MSNQIFVIAEQLNGKFDDITFEMLGKAKEIAGAMGGEVVAVLASVPTVSTEHSIDRTAECFLVLLVQFIDIRATATRLRSLTVNDHHG